jgi:hypothetical protein
VDTDPEKESESGYRLPKTVKKKKEEISCLKRARASPED